MQQFFKLLFTTLNDLTGNYGISLIMLSISVTIIMLPLFWIAEQIQKKDKYIKNKMAPAIKKLDDVSNSQEKHFYTMEIYRIHGYHPIKSLVGLLGLFIQLPFFIGAYRMLENFNALSGIPFGPITDLSKPDGLFFGINLLPVLMTLINLIAGYFFTKQDEDKNSKNQLILVSLVFFVLLYNKPSAMVLYWTFNNFLSIGKNWILGYPPRIPEFKFKSGLSNKEKRTIPPTFSKNFLWVFIEFCFITAAVLLGKENLLSKGITLIFSEIMLIGSIISMVRKKQINALYILSSIIIISLQILILFHSGSFIDSYRTQMMLIVSQVPLFLVNMVILLAHPFSSRLILSYEKKHSLYNKIYLSSALLIFGLIFLYTPLSLYTTDVHSLAYSIKTLSPWHFIFFAIFTLIALFIYRLSKPFIKPVISFLIAYISILFWFYTYILPGNYGELDVTTLTNPGRLNVFSEGFSKAELVLILTEVFILFCSLVFFFRWSIQKLKKTLYLIIFINIASFSQTFFPLLLSTELWNFSSGQDSYLPESPEKYFRFSEKENRLVFMLDMFGGDLIPRIITDYPELKESFSGFTWYSSTLTTGKATFGSLPAILGGADYSPEKINASPSATLEEIYKQAYSVYPTFCKEQGYQMTTAFPKYFPEIEAYSENWGVDVVNPKDFIEYWKSSSDEAAKFNLGLSPIAYSRLYSVIGLFKSVPHFLRPFIYLDGKWLLLVRGDLSLEHTALHLSLIECMQEFLTVDSGPPAFKFINSQLSHHPWSMDSNLNLAIPESPVFIKDPIYNVTVPRTDNHYYTAVRTLFEIKNIIDLLQKYGVKDQTKIVLISDHGYTGINQYWDQNPVLYDKNGTPTEGTARYHSLLLVKDFNANGPFREDNRLMTISDLPSIILSRADDPTLGEEREREVFVNSVPALPGDSGIDFFTINNQFKVKGNPALPENWERIKP